MKILSSQLGNLQTQLASRLQNADGNTYHLIFQRPIQSALNLPGLILYSYVNLVNSGRFGSVCAIPPARDQRGKPGDFIQIFHCI